MQVDIDDAKARLSELVAAAEAGTEVVIARDGTPVVSLAAVRPMFAPVQLGVLAGQIELGADFDDPLPDFADYVDC